MDLQFWIYVAIVVLSILAQARKKKKQQEEQNLPGPTSESPQAPKPISFEDLLREIQQSKQPEPAPKVPQPSYPQYDEVVNYDGDLEAEEKSLEQPAPAYANSYEIYEKAKADAFSRPSLEETMKVEDTDVQFGQFEKYKKVKETVPATSFAETFQDFDQFKRAFVMAEILKPKF
jgi:hypothetical protein